MADESGAAKLSLPERIAARGGTGQGRRTDRQVLVRRVIELTARHSGRQLCARRSEGDRGLYVAADAVLVELDGDRHSETTRQTANSAGADAGLCTYTLADRAVGSAIRAATDAAGAMGVDTARIAIFLTTEAEVLTRRALTKIARAETDAMRITHCCTSGIARAFADVAIAVKHDVDTVIAIADRGSRRTGSERRHAEIPESNDVHGGERLDLTSTGQVGTILDAVDRQLALRQQNYRSR